MHNLTFYLFMFLVHSQNQLLKMLLYLKCCMFQWPFFTVFDLDKGVELMHDTLNERCCSVKKINVKKIV